MNTRLKLFLSFVPMALMGWGNPTWAVTQLITFEESGITAMDNIPTTPVPLGARLDTLFLPTLGVSFSSGAGYAAVVDHGIPSLTPSAPNVLGGTTVNGELDYTAPITVSFFDPNHVTHKATTDFLKVLGDWAGLGSGTVTMAAYDLSGAFLGSVTDTDDKPFGEGPVLALSLSGIHSVVLSGTSGTVGFDNFEFNIPLVPEPNAWVLLIAGLGWLFGYSKWQSKHSGDV